MNVNKRVRTQAMYAEEPIMILLVFMLLALFSGNLQARVEFSTSLANNYKASWSNGVTNTSNVQFYSLGYSYKRWFASINGMRGPTFSCDKSPVGNAVQHREFGYSRDDCSATVQSFRVGYVFYKSFYVFANSRKLHLDYGIDDNFILNSQLLGLGYYKRIAKFSFAVWLSRSLSANTEIWNAGTSTSYSTNVESYNIRLNYLLARHWSLFYGYVMRKSAIPALSANGNDYELKESYSALGVQFSF